MSASNLKVQGVNQVVASLHKTKKDLPPNPKWDSGPDFQAPRLKIKHKRSSVYTIHMKDRLSIRNVLSRLQWVLPW